MRRRATEQMDGELDRFRELEIIFAKNPDKLGQVIDTSDMSVVEVAKYIWNVVSG